MGSAPGMEVVEGRTDHHRRGDGQVEVDLGDRREEGDRT